MTLTTTRKSTAIGRKCMLLGLVGLLAPTLFTEKEALAQRTTATIQVDLTAGGGAPPSGTRVVALDTNTGQTTTATARADGSQILAGLPPGEYLITATPPSGKEVYRLVQVGVAQTVTLGLDIGVAEAPAARGETIIVQGRVSESTTSELATNVSREQIDNLPQNNRNFLNFAQLAPGVRLNQDEFRQEIVSGAVGASQTNVFVDGVSLKSQVQQGGIVGQDASRGNPFPQLAVGGFRVITQNYKAEYEQAGSAIISTQTRSGGNEYHGDVFTQFQNQSLTATDFFIAKRGDPEPDLTRYQVGAAASGPVVKDKLFVFLTYEGNYQNRQNQVFLGTAPAGIDQAQLTPFNFEQYEGNFTSPFREHLGFGKLTWRPRSDQNVDVSASLRTETDIRSFGAPGSAQTSYQAAENVKNYVVTASARHQWWIGSMLNEGTFQFLQNRFNPVAENFDTIGQAFYSGAGDFSPLYIKIGGRDTNQNNGQRGFTLRDDVTFSDIEGAGQHVIKTGAKVSFQHFSQDKKFNENPLFQYFNDPMLGLDYTFPAQAQFGVGDPLIAADDTQIGLYVQDDWQIGRHLTLNLGVRWDIETNMLNNDYETPDEVRAALTEDASYNYNAPDGTPVCASTTFADCMNMVNGDGWFDADRYLTDGGDRPIWLGAIQPRIGFAYDVLGDRRTTIFGGAGRYYDRSLFNDGVDERFRLQHENRTIRFSEDGMPRPDGQPTVMWQNQYLSKEGLQALIDSGTAPPPEIFLLQNDARPLRTDQFSGGVRQEVGPVNATATVTHIRGTGGLAFYPINRSNQGTRDFLPAPTGFGNVLVGVDDRESRFTSFQLQVEKPFNYELSDHGIAWGATAAYTLAWAKQRGYDFFNFDYPTVKDDPLEPTANDERQRLVLSGIVGLPLDFRLSTLITLGTGLPFTVTDQSAGTTPDLVVIEHNGGRDDKFLEFRQVDARVTKEFRLVDEHRISAFIECFNIFNSKNFRDYDGLIPFDDPANPDDGNGVNPTYGKPRQLAGTPRAVQLGMAYHF
ncbi:MAG TPA: TonB-dependent receptor [Kofleriaceae bacterium]|nr:TonB-dependent receptor [Kofleriaceae bacterium]